MNRVNRVKRDKEIYIKYNENNIGIDRLCEMYNLSEHTVKNIIYQVECTENGLPYYSLRTNKHYVYPNVERERVTEGLTCKELAQLVGISNQMLGHKLKGTSDFYLQHALKIKEVLNSELSIEELFKRSDQ